MKCLVELRLGVSQRRSPSGERGLKLRARHWMDMGLRRSPSGERGLKSAETMIGPFPHESLPIRGAWIEIRTTPVWPADARRRSPSGERGLKSYCNTGIKNVSEVAPHPGSVD